MRITQLTTWLSKMATLLTYFEKSPAKVSIPQKHSQDEITSDEEYEKGLDDTYPPSKKLYKKSFCKSWLQTFIWLKYDEAEGCMYCKYCQETQKKNSYTSGCKNFRLSDIQKHGKCHDHRAAAEALSQPIFFIVNDCVTSYCQFFFL